MEIGRRQYETLIGMARRSVALGARDLAADQQLLAHASRLARRGRYQDAEVVLATLPADGPLGPATLDLRARVCAQQGRFLEAELCWIEALRQSPGTPSYRRALDYLEQDRLRPGRFQWLLAILVIVLLVLAVTVLFVDRLGNVWPW